MRVLLRYSETGIGYLDLRSRQGGVWPSIMTLSGNFKKLSLFKGIKRRMRNS